MQGPTSCCCTQKASQLNSSRATHTLADLPNNLMPCFGGARCTGPLPSKLVQCACKGWQVQRARTSTGSTPKAKHLISPHDPFNSANPLYALCPKVRCKLRAYPPQADTDVLHANRPGARNSAQQPACLSSSSPFSQLSLLVPQDSSCYAALDSAEYSHAATVCTGPQKGCPAV